MLVVGRAIAAGEVIRVEGAEVTIPQHLGLGHKIARAAHTPGQQVVKYGAPIGRATQAIAAGDHVHLHNLRSDYTPTHGLTAAGETA